MNQASIETTPSYWGEAQEHLSSADPVMARIISQYPGGIMRSRGDAFQSLLRSIVGQQISVKAADSVWNKLIGVIGHPTPDHVDEVTEEDLRSAGLSGQKVNYVKNLTQHFLDGSITPSQFHDMADEDIIESLTQVKGIGSWTAEMFLMFYLLRPDVFSMKDLGLLKGIEVHYNIPMVQKPTRDERKAYEAKITSHIEIWQPYRTVASWYLWRSLDPVPVEY